ncbi:hypothetical protein F4781DRAFT_427893 [Annulohypoxylon bovei var. microspora]|nr:hypothetical protein F4781DRAFT_427893 [Annulohypoxylon bovei var. microspora]
MGAEDTIPNVPGNCAILVPTSEGNVPIYISDKDICVQYESTGHFCSLPDSFRSSWQHNCPPSSADVLEAAATPSPTPILDSLVTTLSLLPSATPSSSMLPLATPSSTLSAAIMPLGLFDPPQNTDAVAKHDAELAAKGQFVGTSSWDTMIAILAGVAVFVMVLIGIALGGGAVSCCPCGKRARQERQPRP